MGNNSIIKTRIKPRKVRHGVRDARLSPHFSAGEEPGEEPEYEAACTIHSSLVTIIVIISGWSRDYFIAAVRTLCDNVRV